MLFRFFAAASLAAGLVAQPQLLIPLATPQPSSPQPSGCKAASKPLTPEQQAAQEFRTLMVRGKQLSQAVKTVKQLTWQKNLTEASKLAQQENKPILWIQALGTLDGFL